MARNSTLGSILTGARLEARLAASAALNVQADDRHVQLVQREQTRLWNDYAWPHLRVERFIPLQTGQRFYDPAGVRNEAGVIKGDLSIDRIERVDVKSDGDWLPLRNGIGAPEYAVSDSAIGEQEWPPRCWRIYEGEQIEIWPVPDQDIGADQEGYLRLVGIRNLRPLVDVSDRADLDDRLIELYVAANLLSGNEAKQKMALANAHYARLRGALDKTESFRLFGTGPAVPPRPLVARYRAPE